MFIRFLYQNDWILYKILGSKYKSKKVNLKEIIRKIMCWKWSYIKLIDNFSCQLYHNSEWEIKVRLAWLIKYPLPGFKTTYNTVISREALKFFSPIICYFSRFLGFFDGLFDPRYPRQNQKKNSKPLEIKIPGSKLYPPPHFPHY